jgi:hypothetical protein
LGFRSKKKDSQDIVKKEKEEEGMTYWNVDIYKTKGIVCFDSR